MICPNCDSGFSASSFLKRGVVFRSKFFNKLSTETIFFVGKIEQSPRIAAQLAFDIGKSVSVKKSLYLIEAVFRAVKYAVIPSSLFSSRQDHNAGDIRLANRKAGVSSFG